MNRFFLLCLLTSLPLFAFSNTITLDWLNEKPRSYAKNFYIWQFLQQDITPNEAALALEQARNVNEILFFAYAKKIKNDETYAIMQCMQAKASELVATNSDCIAAGLSVNKATLLTYQEKLLAISKLKEKYPFQTEILKVLNAPLPFTKLTASPKEVFFKTFNQCGNSFRENYFNYKLPQSTLDKLLGDAAINRTIVLIVTNPKLNALQESLLENFQSQNLTNNGLFYLGINALIHDKNELALNYFNRAYDQSYLRSDKDKMLFWKYQLTQDKQLLEELSNSSNINIYSLFALEALNKKPNNIIYDIKLEKNKEKNSYNIADPFSWIPIFKELKTVDETQLKSYEKKFNNKDTLPYLAFIYEKYYQFQRNYFITPYEEYIIDYDLDKQALIYAIAKQETHFIPSSISPSYAMGMMQIMPFLSKHIAKELKEEKYDINEMLNIKQNLKFANYQLNYLKKELKHPLFIAYAYNGGIGFSKKMLGSGLFSNMKKRYEPYLSMELVSVDESRHYGKQVLANYYIYKNHLDKKHPLRFSSLVESLQNPYQK
ncbi:MAG: transglycosylase SLT domain-containing protein [Candidatus Marinarcus sp.]|uniref:transglycosylase SLT domain-containing protein n=1 Tax=Candidatus Marinarcus sp. TaxID=3100987 RepID=UPI003B00E465